MSGLERESRMRSSKFCGIYYLCLQDCLWDYLLHGNHAFPDLLLPMSGLSNGDIVSYCCSGKSVLALQAATGRHYWPISPNKGALACQWVWSVFWWVTYYGPVLRNLHCSGLGGGSSDQAVSSCPCVLFPKPVALLLARSNQTHQRQKFHHQQLQIRGKILLMLLLRLNELIIFNSRRSSQ